jgi:hypothetical protein
MAKFAWQDGLLASAIVIACAAIALTAAFAAPAPTPPDFQSGQAAWLHAPGGEFPAVEGSPLPLRQDPAHPFVGNNSGGQPTYRLGDVSNPNLKPWVKDVMAKDNAEILKGKIAFSARSSCLPGGVPVFTLFGGQPIFFIQTPKEVLMIYEGDHQIRHIYLDVPHSRNPKPSWYGESVGRYEGDTLVVDTIGESTRTVLDSYRTPHSDKLHVTERWHLIEGGKALEVNLTIEDPDAFNRPWRTYQRYRRGAATLDEEACAENNQHLFDYHIPVAERPDF